LLVCFRGKLSQRKAPIDAVQYGFQRGYTPSCCPGVTDLDTHRYRMEMNCEVDIVKIIYQDSIVIWKSAHILDLLETSTQKPILNAIAPVTKSRPKKAMPLNTIHARSYNPPTRHSRKTSHPSPYQTQHTPSTHQAQRYPVPPQPQSFHP
jgi:hypothetical protein